MRIGAAATVVMLATVLLLAITSPTFDFDEALYRRVAEEMKQSGDYFVTTWDGQPFYEKPPTYIWTIVLASAVVDGPTPHVSVFASRLPSVICSLLTVVLLAWFWKRTAPQFASAFGTSVDVSRQWLFSPALPALAYGTGLFAMGGAAGVALDPMLTLCLLAPLLIFTGAFLRDEPKLSLAEILCAALGMAAATAVKGLVGIVLPALALALHAAISRKRAVFRAAWPSFALAILGSSIFYATIYQFSGARFFREFFIRQHFVRATTPIQGHHGPLFFHVAVVLLLGGPLVAFVLRAIPSRSALVFARCGFPLTWTATVIVFYSAVATKLLNYTWPVWPALVLTLCTLLMRAYATLDQTGRARRALVVAAFCCLVPIAVVFILLGTGVERWIHAAYTPRAAMIIDAIEPLPVSVRVALLLIGLVLIAQIAEVRRFGLLLDARSRSLWRPLASAAVLNCLALNLVSLIVLPFADHAVRGPLVRLSRTASSQHVAGGDLTTVGLFSPTVSSSYDAGPVRQIGTLQASLFNAPGQHLLLVPAWQSNVCRQPDFIVLRRDKFLMLCQNRNWPPRMTSGTENADSGPVSSIGGLLSGHGAQAPDRMGLSLRRRRRIGPPELSLELQP